MAQTRVRDIGERARRRRQRRRQRALRVAVPILFVIALMAAQGAITLHNYNANRAEALKLSDQVVNAVSDRIVSRVDAFLTPAARMTALFAGRGSQVEDADTWSPRALEPLAREVIRTFDQLAMVNLGTPRGDFVMPKQMPDGSIDTKLIERDGPSPRVTWIRRDTAGATETEEDAPFEGYDPRQRPWYRGALERDGLFWTEPYLFFTGKIPGVTAGFPIRAHDGELLAVAGVDIELEDLSEFLASLDIGAHGRAAIVNTKGQLIAHPRFPELAQSMQNQSTLHVAALDDPALLRTFNAYRIHGAGAIEATLDGERYRLTSHRLPSRLGQNWLVLIAVPENDFVGFVGQNNRQTLILSLSVLGVAALLAGLLAVQGIRADRNAQLVLDQRERLEAQSRAIVALGQDARVLDPDDQAGLTMLTETASEAAGVRRASIWLIESQLLRCADVFDATNAEHAAGTALERGRLRDLFAELESQPCIAASHVPTQPHLYTLYRQYFGPAGMDAALLTPLRVGGTCVGLLILEDDTPALDWPADTVNFAQTLAAMLAVRFRAQAPQLASSETPEPAATVATDADSPDPAPQHPAPTVAEVDVQCCDDATVLVIECEARPGMNGSAADGADTITPFDLINRLVCCLEAWRDRFGITAESVLDERIVVVSESDAPRESAARMAQLALELQAYARQHDPDDRVAVHMGLHTGAVTRAELGTKRRLQELSGPAVHMALFLAGLGTRDEIQVSESTHSLIGAQFLLQGRGRFYTEPFGEMQVYLLNDVQAAPGGRA